VKRILFTLIPVTLLLAAAELVTRAFELDRARMVAGGSGLGPNSIQPSTTRELTHVSGITEFAQARGIQLFDAHASLHPSDDSRPMYVDTWHPSRWGHQRLATGLAAHLVETLRERVAKIPSE
jgi:hypothetical protein